MGPNLSAASLAQFRHNASGKTVHAAFAWINSWHEPKKMRAFKQFDLYWEHAKKTAEAAGYGVEEFIVDSQTNVARLQNILVPEISAAS